MLPLIEQHRAQIDEICRRRNVKTLELFGSAARGDFDPDKSDLDFFVELADYDAPTIVDDWFGLMEDLEALLGRSVDILSPSEVRNPYFLEVATEHRVMLYAA